MSGYQESDEDESLSMSMSMTSASTKLMGLSHAPSTHTYNPSAYTNDEMSMAYSVDQSRASAFISAADDQSRASGFISAASEDESGLGSSYYHPALPTPAEDPAEPPPPPQPQQPSQWESFKHSPLEYIFGGNDDDVSTLGGYNEWYHDGDDSTIATTPTVAREFRNIQPTIFEDEDEEASIAASSKAGSIMTKSQDLSEYGGVSAASASQGGNGNMYGSGTYDPSGRQDDASASISASGRSFAEESSRASSYTAPSVTKPKNRRISFSDEDASRSRASGDASVGLDPISEEEPLSRRAPQKWTEADSASVHSSRSHLIQRNVSSNNSNNKSWRSERSSFTGGASVRSHRTTGSVMPDTPEVMEEGSGVVMKTRGMSGRAVVHVNVEKSRDGDIDNVAFTTPLVEETDRDMFSDEDTVGTDNRNMPWYSYFASRSKLVQLCNSRKCYRINAMILVSLLVVLSVTFSIVATLDQSDGGSASQTTKAKEVSLADIIPPRAIQGVSMPNIIENHLLDWFDKYGQYTAVENDVPFYFDVPLAGALVGSESWGACLGFTVASNVGKAEANDSTLKSTIVFGLSFANVDVTTKEGIEHASRMQLVPSGLPDVIISPEFVNVVANLYSTSHRNKLIFTMRNPIDRAVAMFNYFKTATNDPDYDPVVAAMTLQQWALSGRMENNYVVRLITGKSTGSLTSSDLDFCKELLRRKAVIGVYEELEESLDHIERYFGWIPSSDSARQCLTKSVSDGLAKGAAQALDTGSSAYALIKQQNLLDMQLYDYVHNILWPFQHEVIGRQTDADLTTGGDTSIA